MISYLGTKNSSSWVNFCVKFGHQSRGLSYGFLDYGLPIDWHILSLAYLKAMHYLATSISAVDGDSKYDTILFSLLGKACPPETIMKVKWGS